MMNDAVPTVAKQALRQKKLYENELDSISGRKMTLTTQVCTSAPPCALQLSETSSLRDRTRNRPRSGVALLLLLVLVIQRPIADVLPASVRLPSSLSLSLDASLPSASAPKR